jgi:hypothetical protein
MRIPIGCAQEVGSLHLAKVSLKSYYDAHLHITGVSQQRAES